MEPWVWFGGTLTGAAGGLGAAVGELGAVVGPCPTLALLLPVVALPRWLPEGVVVVVVGPGELVLLTLFRVTGSQPEKAPGFGAGFGAAAWFTASGTAVLVDGLLVLGEGWAKPPALLTWARSSDRIPLAGDDERLRDDLMSHD
ncbi:hypothetical protein [Sorangium sp. So ce1153]|uniref:hypothetical protein n=1 Tax=Sorangium sp. So ce1153 TaxID=3133333 RepID=UPI003F6277E8